MSATDMSSSLTEISDSIVSATSSLATFSTGAVGGATGGADVCSLPAARAFMILRIPVLCAAKSGAMLAI